MDTWQTPAPNEPDTAQPTAGASHTNVSAFSPYPQASSSRDGLPAGRGVVQLYQAKREPIRLRISLPRGPPQPEEPTAVPGVPAHEPVDL